MKLHSLILALAALATAACTAQQAEDYAAATGLEALFGYLYLSGQDERIESIIQRIKEQEREHG